MREVVGGLDDKTHALPPILWDLNKQGTNSMTKKEIVHNLSNVKLVLGNGFDLHCGLKTSYNDFFHSDSFRLDNIKQNSQKLARYESDPYLYDITDLYDFWVERGIYLGDISFWDYLFYLLTYKKEQTENTKEWNWCSIEKILGQFLLSEPDTICTEDNSSNNNFNSDIKILWHFMNEYLEEKSGKKLSDIDSISLCELLLKELEILENRFGNYVQKNASETNDYSKNVLETIQKLCSLKNLIDIDTFNYTESNVPWIKSITHHINGNWRKPIFGISFDSDQKDNPLSIFTKRNRRKRLNIDINEWNENNNFKNVVIFGHSLDKVDYDYFFYIFNKIQIADLNNDSSVVFAYANYKPNVRDDTFDAMINLFQSYFEEMHYLNWLDLTEQMIDKNKIILYDIDEAEA